MEREGRSMTELTEGDKMAMTDRKCPKCGAETGHNSEYTYGGDLIVSQEICLECGWEGEPG